ncbi:MAG: helix-turn-helix domain-containing protein [Spirochaetales bacterium]|nr:helix-turn-helix domain-containing protein [Spirochaetales bacterium]
MTRKEGRTTFSPVKKNSRDNTKTKREIHIKILITVTLSVTLSIIILTIVFYFYFENIVINKIYESEKNNLFQAGVSTKLMQELSKSIAIQMFNDFTLSGLFFTPLNDPVEIYKTLTHFKKYKDLIPYIHSIYIYNPSNNTYYINSPAKTFMIQSIGTFFDEEIHSILQNSEHFNTLIPIPRIIREPGVTQNYFDEYGVYTFVFNLSGVRSMKHSGTIIINISEKWVRDIIDSVDINPDIKVLIIDKDDRLLIGDTAKKPMLSNAHIYEYIRAVLSPENKSGILLLDLDSKRTLLVFSFIESFKWIFVKLIPYSTIMDDLFEMRKNLLFIAASILLLGTLFSFILAKRLYKPIDDIVKKLIAIEADRKSDTLLLKQYNLRRLFTQSNELSDYELNRFLQELNIGLDTDCGYTLLMVNIDRYAEISEHYSGHEQNLLRVGIIDAATQIVKKKYRNEGIETSDHQLVFIINIGHDAGDSVRESVMSIAEEIRIYIEKTYEITVSVVVGSMKKSKKDISLLYEEVLHMAQYKYILGNGVIIDESLIAGMHGNRDTFVYPYEKEKQLVEAMHYADRDSLIAAFNDIIDSALPYGYNAIITSRNTVAYTVNKTINKLIRRHILEFSFDFYNFFSRLINSETIGEAKKLFNALFDVFLSAIEKRNSTAHNSLVNTIVDVIHHSYMDINLGISTFAYKYKLSAAYLGRLFKRITGKSMTDVINEVRIARVEELLENTSLPMLKIMEMTGFTNKTHFYKIFKKYNGVTPRLYRQKTVTEKKE